MEKPRKSIRKYLLISLTLLSITPLIILGVILSWETYVVQVYQVRETQRALSVVVREKIKKYISEQRILLLSTMSTTDIMKQNLHDKQNILSRLLSSTVNREYGKVFQDLILLNNDGHEEVHFSRTEIYTETDLKDLSRSPEYTEIIKGTDFYYSPVFFHEETGEPLLSISMPIKNLRTLQIKGLLIANIRMKYMWNVIANINIGKTGTAYILNDKRRVIAHPNPSFVLKESYFTFDDSEIIVNGLAGKPAVVVSEVMEIGKQIYYIITELPTQEALSYIRYSLFITVIFTLLTLFFAGILTFLLLRKIVRPVESLANIAQDISGGEYHLKAELRGDDELTYLAGSFNIMTSRLLDSIKSLEENIEERKKAENQLVLSLKEKEILLREVHHRVKNNMQVITSLLNMQLKKMHNKDDIEMIKSTQLRIKSMSLIHEKLYKSESVASVNFSSYIEELIELLGKSFKGYCSHIKFHVQVKDVFLNLDNAISCGFIVNELVTNSLKYAFPSHENGQIWINVAAKEDDFIEIMIKDDGVGIPPDLNLKDIDSVGLSLVTMLSELQLGGKVELTRDNGTEFKITFKIRN